MSRTGRIVAGALGAGALALVVLGSAVRGPLPVTGGPVLTEEDALPIETAPPEEGSIDELVRELSELEAGDAWSGVDLGPILSIVALVVVAIALAWFVRRMLRARSVVISAADDAEPGLTDAEADAARVPVLREGIEAARTALADVRPPRDAIVAAWLHLEDAASEVGIERGPAETPTEFTLEILTRTGADEAASRELLRLYHRARFSTHRLGPADVARAVDCLETIESGWPAPARSGS